MVQTLATNSNNDLVLNSSESLTMLNGIQAVAAACTSAAKAQLGEMVLETGKGLPNFSLIWVGTPDYQLWESYLQNTFLNVEGVTQVNSISLSAADHVLSYVAKISTIYGPTNIQGTING